MTPLGVRDLRSSTLDAFQRHLRQLDAIVAKLKARNGPQKELFFLCPRWCRKWLAQIAQTMFYRRCRSEREMSLGRAHQVSTLETQRLGGAWKATGRARGSEIHHSTYRKPASFYLL